MLTTALFFQATPTGVQSVCTPHGLYTYSENLTGLPTEFSFSSNSTKYLSPFLWSCFSSTFRIRTKEYFLNWRKTKSHNYYQNEYKFETVGLKIMAGQWTMSGQDDNLSGQTFGLLLFLIRRVKSPRQKRHFFKHFDQSEERTSRDMLLTELTYLWPNLSTGPKFILSPNGAHESLASALLPRWTFQ